jgi:hypothetical protein
MSINILTAYEEFTWENFTLIGKELSKIDRENINEELIKHPTLFQQYISLLALSKKQLDELTSDLNITTSRLRKEHKRESFPKKMTAKDLDDLVFADAEYVQAVDKVTEANHRYLMVKGMVSTMEHKKDCLVQLSSNSRQETKLYS